MSVSIKKETITPTMAQKFLDEQSTRQRRKREKTHASYARDMSRGNWEDTAEPLTSNGHGQMCDGQHRCQAIVDSGKPQRLWVARGLTKSAADCIDTGVVRTLGDVFNRDGVQNYNHVAHAVKVLHALRQQSMRAYKDRFPNHLGLKILRSNRKIAEYVHELLAGDKLISVGVLGGVYAHAAAITSERIAKSFCMPLADGTNLDRSSVLYKTRRKFHSWRVGEGSVGREVRLMVVIKAWNAIRSNTDLDTRIYETDKCEMQR
jgi:hypothetical protein